MQRHRAAVLATAATVVVPWLAAIAAAAPATVDTTIPPEDTFVFAPEDTLEGGGFVDAPDESTTTSTTTTLPSAVTTVPPGCPTAPLAQAVFVGTATSRDETSVVFTVDQLRAGSIDAFVREGRVTVRYGGDARFVETGRVYIVGATVADPAAQVLQSTIRDEAVVIGEPEGLAVGPVCPEFEEVARTLNDDGTAVEASSASVFFSEPWRVIAAVALPALMVLALLVGAVFARRGVAR
ncbi:MAG: hypothetical protein RLY50_330 [Actinomycetota bacterium]